MGKNYWMLTLSLENFLITRERDFRIQGVRKSMRKRAQRMHPDDRILYYIEGLQKFGATATITSKCFEQHQPIWRSHNGEEDFPHRIETKPNYVLKEDNYIDAKQIGPRLDYVKKWPPERWHLAFHGGLHLLPKKDFNLIEGEMKKLTLRDGKARRSRKSRNEERQPSG